MTITIAIALALALALAILTRSTAIISRHKAITIAMKIILTTAIVTIELAVGTTIATTAGIAMTLKNDNGQHNNSNISKSSTRNSNRNKKNIISNENNINFDRSISNKINRMAMTAKLVAMTIISTMAVATATRSIE